jgi:hypothetical protein
MPQALAFMLMEQAIHPACDFVGKAKSEHHEPDAECTAIGHRRVGWLLRSLAFEKSSFDANHRRSMA